MSQTITVTVVDQERYDHGPFNFGEIYENGSLDTVIESLCAIRNAIPEQYRSVARCMIGSSGGWEGEHYANIKVTYVRLETTEETRRRIANDQIGVDAHEAHERKLYAALHAKYGNREAVTRGTDGLIPK